MREEEFLRALLSADPAGFTRYVDMLKREHARRDVVYNRIELFGRVFCLPLFSMPFLLLLLGYGSAALRTLAVAIVVNACVSIVELFLLRRMYRVARVILRAENPATPGSS